jgi:hypothetical protein
MAIETTRVTMKVVNWTKRLSAVPPARQRGDADGGLRRAAHAVRASAHNN